MSKFGLDKIKSKLSKRDDPSSKRTSSVEDDFDALSVEPSSSDIDGSADILERFGISSDIVLPDNVLTTGQIEKTNIRVYESGGYVIEDVEGFHQTVLDTVTWYARTLHNRNLDIHRLATELDKSHTDFMNMKYQTELFRGSANKALVNDDGTLVTESQLEKDPETALQVAQLKIKELEESLENSHNKNLELNSQNSELQQQLASSRRQKALPTVVTEKSASDVSMTPEDVARLQELETWAGQVEVAYTDLETKYTQLEEQHAILKSQGASSEELEGLRSQVEELEVLIGEKSALLETAEAERAELQGTVEELQTHISEMTTYTEQLNTFIDELQSHDAESDKPASVDVEDEDDTDLIDEPVDEEEYQEDTSSDVKPYDNTDYVGDSDSDNPLTFELAEEEPPTRRPYAPELPEGYILPSQKVKKKKSEFAPAAPGAPLTSLRAGEDLKDVL